MKIPTNPFSKETEDLQVNLNYLTIAVVCLFVLILFRFWYLQIIRGHDFRALSEQNRTRSQEILPPRGLIMDRNGLVLVDNYPSYEMAVIREDLQDSNEFIRRVSSLLDKPWAETAEDYEATKNQPAFKPAVMMTGLSQENLVALESHRFELPGMVIQVKPRRKYLYEYLASHVIGYLGEVTSDQLKQEKYDQYKMGELTGRSGLERGWENNLHGQRGRRLVEVDASGRVLKVIEKLEPVPGNNLYLTLDARLQRVAQEALGGNTGAVVALDPNNGEILVMASNPTFNQNDFVEGLQPEKWEALLQNPLHPLENRALSGQYPPGSTFKIVMATAALEAGVVTPETLVPCTGSYPYGNRTFLCWNRGGHGMVDMHRAIKESCDIYFYEMGRRLGIDRLGEWAYNFGLGREPGLDLGNEKAGVVPGKEWKKNRFGQSWQGGETLTVAIGQGYLLVTPLQMAQVAAVAANGGVLYKARLVKAVTDSEGQITRQYEPEVVRQLNLKPETVRVVQKGLAAVVNEPGGTGSRVKLPQVMVAGKTGTAQVVNLKRYQSWQGKEPPYEYRDHAWFVAYAPVEKPRIAVAVLVEHAGHGGVTAAPIAREVLEAFFNRDKGADKIKIATYEPLTGPVDQP